MTSSFSPLAASEAMYASVHLGDWDAVEDFMADDFVIYEPESLPYGGEWRGKDALRRLFAHVMGFWSDPRVGWDELVGGKRHAVALLHFAVPYAPPVSGWIPRSQKLPVSTRRV